MGIEQIFIFTFGTFTTLILFCACRNYCKKRVREIREKIKNKKLQHILKRNNTVKPITEADEKKATMVLNGLMKKKIDLPNEASNIATDV